MHRAPARPHDPGQPYFHTGENHNPDLYRYHHWHHHSDIHLVPDHGAYNIPDQLGPNGLPNRIANHLETDHVTDHITNLIEPDHEPDRGPDNHESDDVADSLPHSLPQLLCPNSFPHRFANDQQSNTQSNGFADHTEPNSQSHVNPQPHRYTQHFQSHKSTLSLTQFVFPYCYPHRFADDQQPHSQSNGVADVDVPHSQSNSFHAHGEPHR